MTGNANRAEIVFVAGATGSGKTQWLLRRLARPKRKRLMVWSPKEAIDNYAARFGGQLVRSSAECLAAVKAAGAGPLCIVFAPPGSRKKDMQLFSVFCEIARLARNVCCIVEELHTVTYPSSAPEGWSKLNLMGRGYGASIYALSQRPASVDKDFFGNCTLFHCGRLSYEDDAKVMGRLLGVAPNDIMSLPDLHYIEREPRTGGAVRGVVKIAPH